MVDKIKKKLSEPKFYYWLLGIGAFLITLGSCYMTYANKLKEKNMFSGWMVVLFILLVAVLSGIFLGIYAWQKKHKTKIEKLFLLLAIPLGIVYLLIAPILTGNDDPNHMMRIYEISQGNITSEASENMVGGEYPKGFGTLVSIDKKYGNTAEMIKVEMSDEKTFYNYSNTSLYSPLSYIPQVMGMSIGNVFHAPPFVLGTLARVFNLIFYIVICYFGLKLVPRLKLFLLVLLLTPSMMAGATTLSADAFMMALVFLYVAFVMHIIFEKKAVTKKSLALITALAAVIAGCKIVYLPVIFLVLLINKKQFGGKKKKVCYALVPILAGLIVGILWLKLASGVLETAYPLADDAMSFVLRHPHKFLMAVARTFLTTIRTLLGNALAPSRMYHDRLGIYELVTLGFLIIGVLAILNDKIENKLNKWQKFVFVIVACMIVGITCGALYTQWTPQNCGNNPGCNFVIGLQGRYFVPVIMLLVMVVGRSKARISRNGVLLSMLALDLLTSIAIFIGFIA